MENCDGDALVSTQVEDGYKVKESYTLSNDIDNSLLWDKIGQLMDQYAKYNKDSTKDDERIYMFSKMFKDYLIPQTCIII